MRKVDENLRGHVLSYTSLVAKRFCAHVAGQSSSFLLGAEIKKTEKKTKRVSDEIALSLLFALGWAR